MAPAASRPGVLARRMLGVPKNFQGNAEIFGQGEPVDYLYEVVSGAVRSTKVLSDGRRQIGGVYFAGDIFGLEHGNEHSLGAEAVVPSTIRVIKRRTLVQLTADDRALAEDLLAMAMCQVERMHRHELMLIMTAQERVNSFLTEMGQRISIGDVISLPMSRQDIADHVGLTIETVSRIFTDLAGGLTIRLTSARMIVLRDRPARERGTGRGGLLD